MQALCTDIHNFVYYEEVLTDIFYDFTNSPKTDKINFIIKII